MAPSLAIPSFKGFLALGAIVMNALIIPALIPAYDGPGFKPMHGFIAIVLGVLTIVVCLRCLQRGRVADKVAALASALFACWMFYVLIGRVV